MGLYIYIYIFLFKLLFYSSQYLLIIVSIFLDLLLCCYLSLKEHLIFGQCTISLMSLTVDAFSNVKIRK